jgi:O-antigen/teichoic acid export membrane protein
LKDQKKIQSSQSSSTPPPTKELKKEPKLDTPFKPDLSLLKRLALKGSIWVLLGFGIAQILRIFGNVILTRLLTPEVFGIMGLVTALLMGLNMFSDLGLRGSIIRSQRGEEPIFLRTAWCIQIIRGFVLALFAAILALPIGLLNQEQSLFLIIPIAGLSMIISGFNSTWLLVYSRRMILNKLVILDIIAQVLSLVTMITWAWLSPTIWALVFGNFVSSFFKLIVSHTFFKGVPMQFQWEPTVVRELILFGRWIFISSALGFLVSRLDIFVFGSVAGMTVLGFFILAKTLSSVITVALTKLSSMVLLPIYSRLAERNIATLRHNTFKIRGLLLTLFLPPLWMLVFWGDEIINVLYDERYQNAGWMLQILAAGAIPTAVITTIRPVLLAVGDSFRHMLNSLVRACFQILGMFIGYQVAGVPGFLVGLGLADLLSYPFTAYLIYPYRIWLPQLDISALGISAIVVGMAWWTH